VPLCREEVKRLENRQELNQYENTRNPAWDNDSSVEEFLLWIYRAQEVTL
jgi:hypothetical protein